MDWLNDFFRQLQTVDVSFPSVCSGDNGRVTDDALNTFRLDFLLNRLKIRNSQLARSLNIDSSLVSRWRSGERTLSRSNPLHDELVIYLCRQLISLVDFSVSRQVDNDADLPGSYNLEKMQPGRYRGLRAVLEDEDRLQRAVSGWLFSEDDENGHISHAIDSFLDRVIHLTNDFVICHQAVRDDLQNRFENNPYLTTFFAKSRSTSNRRVFYGVDGLREVVIRFLIDIVDSGKKCQLKLFSNQDISWLVSDRQFAEAWTFLMQMLLEKGHEIEIIHYFSRSPVEIVMAIGKWLPLYLLGKIDPYCFESEGNLQDSVRMTKTLFINSGHFAISGNFFRGTEDTALCHYVRRKDVLKFLENQFEFLQNRSLSFGRIERGLEAQNERNRMLRTSVLEKANGEVFRLASSALPLYLLPDEFLLLIIERIKSTGLYYLTEEKEKNLRRSFQESKAFLKRFLKRKNKLYFALPCRPAGNVIDLDCFPFAELSIPVDPGFYDVIWQKLQACSKQAGNIHLYSLRKLPFTQLTLFIQDGAFANIYKKGGAPLTIEVRHPTLRDAFSQYVQNYFRPDQSSI